MKKKALGVMCVVAFVFFISSFANAAEVIKLKFANYFPPMHRAFDHHG